MLGKLRVNKFYEIVGIDVLMHTMSDQIGENDDFYTESTNIQTQHEIYKQRYRKTAEHHDASEEQREIKKKAGEMF